MSLASKFGTLTGTALAYIVHYGASATTLLGVVGIAYSYRNEIIDFAAQHSLGNPTDDIISDNLFDCLEYID